MVYIFLADGFEEMEAIAPGDILRRGNVDVKYVGVNGKVIRGSHDIRVTSDIELSQSLEISSADYVVIPGGLGGVVGIESSETAMSVLKKALDNGAKFAAICAGPRVLSRLGILQGHNFTCYPGMETQMIGGNHVAGNSVVCDKELITGRAPGSAIDFGLALLNALKGSDKTDKIRNDLVYGS